MSKDNTAPIIGYWDTEWTPAVSYTWSGFPKYLPNDFLIEEARMLCFGFAFEGEETIVVDERIGYKKMLRKLWKLLDKVDVLVSYNGIKFDTRKVNAEFMKYKMKPPSPYKHIDLLRQIKRDATFYSHKLDFVGDKISRHRKVDTGGFQLWKDVMDGDDKAWKKMRKYQKQDVDLLIKLFDDVRPWIRVPVSLNAPTDGVRKCTNCGSVDLHRRGYAHTLTTRYQRYRCNKCGKWLRGTAYKRANYVRQVI